MHLASRSGPVSFTIKADHLAAKAKQIKFGTAHPPEVTIVKLQGKLQALEVKNQNEGLGPEKGSPLCQIFGMHLHCESTAHS